MRGAFAPENGQVLRRRWKGRRTGAEETSDISQISLYAIFARTARTVFTITTIRARAAVAEATTVRTVAITTRTIVTVALLHHGRRAFLVLFDSDRHVAQNVFAD